MNYLSEKARSIVPYTPGEQPRDKKYIKINTNENPYPISPAAAQAAQAALADSPLYPDPEAVQLKEVIARREGLDISQVFCSNGSDEALAFSFMAFFDKSKKVLFSDITYSFYPVYARLFGIAYETVPLDENFQIDVDKYMKDNGGIIFPNPNAPTGIFLPLVKIEELLEYNLDKAAVIVDEAYIAFGGESAAGLINKYPNLLVVRTLSKSHSMAGLRVGYCLGNSALIDGLNRIKNSFNSYVVDRCAMAAAAAGLADEEYYNQTSRKIMATRERVRNRLLELGFSVLPSAANFIFISPPGQDARGLYSFLREHGVLVRYFEGERVDKFIRVTIGTDEQMNEFLRIAELFLNK